MGELLIVSVVLLVVLLITAGCTLCVLYHIRNLFMEIKMMHDEKAEIERHKNELYMAIRKNISQGAAKK